MMPERVEPPRRRWSFGDGLSQVWERLEARGKKQEEERSEEWNASAVLFAELMALADGEQRERVFADERLRTLAFADRLLQASERSRGRRRQGLVELALEILGGLDRERYGAATVTGREVLAWCLWAEARRRLGDAAGAEDGLRRAAGRLSGQPLDAWERAVFCRGRANLCRDREAEDEALALLYRAADLYLLWGEPRPAAEVLCEAADLWLRSGDPETALSLFEAAVDPLDVTQYPEVGICAWQGIALCQVQLCERETAAEALGRAQALYALVPSVVARLRYLTGEARIAAENEQEGRAISLLRPVIGRLLEERADEEATLAALDLAEIFAARGQTGDVRKLAEQLAPLAEVERFPEAKGSVLRFALRFATKPNRDITEVFAQVREYLERAGDAPQPWEWTGSTTSEVHWGQAGPELRRRLCEDAGLPPVFAAFEANEMSRRDQRLINWMCQVETGVRIVFATPETV